MSGALGDHPLARQFNALDPLQILDAIQLPGWFPTGRVMALNSYENRVYQIELEDADGALRTVVGKFYRPGRWSRAAIEDEHDFLFDLADARVPVVLPLPLGDDEDETLGELSGAAAGIYFSLFPRVSGRPPEELTDGQLAELGALLARLHTVGEAHDAPDRPALDPTTYGWDNLAFLLENRLIPEAARDAFAGTVEAVLRAMEPLFAGVPTHRIHGDCHKGNLLDTGRGLTLLDFDDLVIGPAVQDVWLLAPAPDADGHRQRLRIADAYRAERDFDPRWLRLVEPLRSLRMIHFSTWIARRFDDPIFRRTFDHFGTVRYWQDETSALREQLARGWADPGDDFAG
ncbi:MAG: serine/threonine protein kinase [Myxococcales bacterium]|nr:serine/threonine protein kinase [Myxococcales bacterium]